MVNHRLRETPSSRASAPDVPAAHANRRRAVELKNIRTRVEVSVSDPTESPATSKGQRRRQEIVEGAAQILLEHGPQGVSHRAVAQRVGCSLSATTYYFSGLDELLSEAGRVNIADGPPAPTRRGSSRS